jgi:ElaB/YqjD/DUF883 family membrane-anchored ribosome-binding protein
MASTQTQKEFKALRQDLDEVRGDLRALLEAIHSDGSGQYDSLKQALHEKADRVRGGVGRAVEAGRECATEFEQKVEEHPLTSVAVALGAGVILGHLLGRK